MLLCMLSRRTRLLRQREQQQEKEQERLALKTAPLPGTRQHSVARTALACCLVFCLKVGACVAVCAFACYRSGVGVEGVEPLPRIELANFMAKAEEGAA